MGKIAVEIEVIQTIHVETDDDDIATTVAWKVFGQSEGTKIPGDHPAEIIFSDGEVIDCATVK
jgi:hypothetical protein